MIANLKVRKIGNSLGVILPQDVTKRLNLEEDSELVLTESEDGMRLTVPQDRDAFQKQLAAARDIMDRYKTALRELAK
jgi:putative addiction module antidote